MGSRGENQLLPGCFPKLCSWEEKREGGEGEGEAGTVGGQAGDTELQGITAHPAAPQTAVRCWSQPTAPATWLWGCWPHLGVTVPGYSMEGCGETHRLLQEMGQGSFQPLKARQQWDAGLCEAFPALPCPGKAPGSFADGWGGFNPAGCRQPFKPGH